MTCRFDVYYWKGSFVWLSVAIKKVGLVDLIHVKKRKNLHIKGRMKPVDILDLTCIAAAGLNHLIDHLLD